MKKVNRDTAEHYKWQEICDGWHLVHRDDFSVIEEQMPPEYALSHTSKTIFLYTIRQGNYEIC